MSPLVLLSLIAYLATLAVTQTVYGMGFMTYRWLTLGMLFLVSTADWVVQRSLGKNPEDGDNTNILMLYLMTTFITVIYAENWQFSGMRWGSHAIMLIVTMVYLRQSASHAQVERILLLLKVVFVSLLITSWMAPAPPTKFANTIFFRGAMSNANTMGHIALITALLFIHDTLTGKTGWWRSVKAIIAVSAIATVWSSGARSSVLAFLCGLGLIAYYYRAKIRGSLLMMILAGSLSFMAFPNLPREVMRFLVKRADTRVEFTEQVLKTRAPVWEASLDGFRQRPISGWGFGADNTVSRDWELKFTALGTVTRDAVNDFFFMMEGCGIIGVVAYLLLWRLIIRQRPTRRQNAFLNKSRVPLPYAWKGDSGKTDSHAVMYILALSLIVLSQFDGTALSAGNLISVVLWIAAGSAGAIRRQAALEERAAILLEIPAHRRVVQEEVEHAV